MMYREVRGLHQAAYVLAVLTFGSQLLALVRDRLLAHQFGAGSELDLYYTAFRIPDLLYVLFASTLSVYVLIPFVAERMRNEHKEAAQLLLSRVFSLFVIVYIVLGLALAIGAPQVVGVVFPGLAAQHDLLVWLIRILLLQPLLLGVSSLFGVITQLQHRFVLYALSPLLYNLGIIVGLLFLYPLYGIYGLVWGVILGALAHLLIQLPLVLPSHLAPRPTLSIPWKEIAPILRTSIPRALTLSLHQLVLLVLIAVAGSMTVGSVSVFQFAFNLQSVPLAIIGVSYSVAAFPLLAQLYAERQFAQFARHIETAMRHILFWSVPVIALAIVIRAQFVRVVLGSGAFDWDDTRLTAAVFALFMLSLAAQAIYLLVVRALYAAGNTRLPFYVTLGSSLCAVGAALTCHQLVVSVPALAEWLAALMRLEGVSGIEVLALPLGYSFAMLVSTKVLVLLARKELRIRLRTIGGHALQTVLAGFGGGVVAYFALNILVSVLHTELLLGILLQGFLAGIAGICGTALVYFLLGNEELREVSEALKRRIFKTEVVAPQDEDHLAV